MPAFTVRQTTDFAAWHGGLAGQKARHAITARLTRLEIGLIGDAKNVGGGVSELRIDVGPGYRVYFTRSGKTILLVLAGGDKATQKADIKRAQALVEALKAAAKAKRTEKR
jgi:putative addiction module killer protein